MHKLLFRFFLGGLLIFTTSCFEVIEEVSLRKDGSGAFTYTLNASQSKVKLKSVMLMDSINGRPVPSIKEIETELAELKQALAQQSGMSKVLVEMDHESFIYTLKAEFNSINQLNQALNSVAKAQMKKRPQAPPFIPFDNYLFDGKTFTRKAPQENRSQEYYKAKAEDREMMDQAQAVGIYRFETPVRSASHPQARISPSGKAVMVRASVADLILQRVPLQNEIQLQ